jgi:hypothetical protein
MQALVALSASNILLSPSIPLRLQIAPILIETKACPIQDIINQLDLTQFRTSIGLRPKTQGESVKATIVNYAWRDGKACLRPDVRDVFAVLVA